MIPAQGDVGAELSGSSSLAKGDARESAPHADRRPLRVVYLAAGAAGMYCGSCLRDNRLAATLIAQGRDATLIPLYTPLRTDERDVSRPRVYYGGVNVYLRHASRLFRSAPRWMTRWLDRPGVLNWVSRFAGGTRPEQLGGLTVSVLRGEHGPQRGELERLARDLADLRPDVVNLPDLMMLGLAREIRRHTGAAVLCTLSGENIFLDRLVEPFRTEAFNLIAERAADCDAYVALTRYFAEHATRHFRLPADRVHVARMGIRVDDFTPPPPAAAPPSIAAVTIGYLARICPEKGLAVLCEAAGRLRRSGRALQVRAAGYLGKSDRPYLEHIQSMIGGWGLAGAFEYVGEVNRAEKARFLHACDVFSVPSVYAEAKGLYVLEAMAAGLPVVLPRHGSFPELIDDTGGGIVYDPNSIDALAAALDGLIGDPARRRALALRGQSAVRERFNDAAMADETWAIYERYRPAGR